jgi:hypothetical protein
MIGRVHRTLPVIAAIGGTSSAWNVIPTAGVTPTPSSCRTKSRLPEVAPVLAVRDGGQAERFLLRHRRADASVLDLAELRRGQDARLGPGARLAQLGRAQEATDLIGPKRGLCNHRRLL